jgi:3-mercaptopyruvate sulfurtransferase SseA
VAHALVRAGWSDVRPLLGGFDAWRRAGYPLEKKTGGSRELERTKEIQENLRDAEGDIFQS